VTLAQDVGRLILVNACAAAVATFVVVCGCDSSNSSGDSPYCGYNGGQWDCPGIGTYPAGKERD
jgi:hypothetical protein